MHLPSKQEFHRGLESHYPLNFKMSHNKIKFAVFELFSDGKEYDTGRTFIVDKGKDQYYIITDMFTQLYQFTIGPNGFILHWERDQNGNLLEFEAGRIYWAGPRPPALNCGGNWWRIKKIKE